MNEKFKLLIFELIAFIFLALLVSGKEIEIEDKNPLCAGFSSNDEFVATKTDFDLCFFSVISTIWVDNSVAFYVNYKCLGNNSSDEQLIIYCLSALIPLPRYPPVS